MPRRTMTELLLTLRTRRTNSPAHSAPDSAPDSVAAFADSSAGEARRYDAYDGFGGIDGIDGIDGIGGYEKYAGIDGVVGGDESAADRQELRDTAPPGIHDRQHAVQHAPPDTLPTPSFEYTPEYTPAPADAPSAQDASLTHERARALLLKQRDSLLPPADANALADHLLDCDACYRYAQDVAAQRHTALP